MISFNMLLATFPLKRVTEHPCDNFQRFMLIDKTRVTTVPRFFVCVNSVMQNFDDLQLFILSRSVVLWLSLGLCGDFHLELGVGEHVLLPCSYNC